MITQYQSDLDGKRISQCTPSLCDKETVRRLISVGTRKRKVWLACLFLVVHGSCGNAHAISLLLGSDYLAGENGFFDIGTIDIPGLGVVTIPGFNVLGARPGGVGMLGNTDTIIERLQDATGFSGGDPTFERAIVNARLKEMALQSNGLVNVGGENFEVRLRFTPDGIGQLRIQHEFGSVDFGLLQGGVISPVPLPAQLGLFLRPITGAPEISKVLDDVTITFGGSNFWSTDPVPGTPLFPGSPGDQAANQHIPLNGDFDFYPDTGFFPWEFGVEHQGREIGFVTLRSASAKVPDGGPGIMGSLVILIACAAGHLWRTRFARQAI